MHTLKTTLARNPFKKWSLNFKIQPFHEIKFRNIYPRKFPSQNKTCTISPPTVTKPYHIFPVQRCDLPFTFSLSLPATLSFLRTETNYSDKSYFLNIIHHSLSLHKTFSPVARLLLIALPPLSICTYSFPQLSPGLKRWHVPYLYALTEGNIPIDTHTHAD